MGIIHMGIIRMRGHTGIILTRILITADIIDLESGNGNCPKDRFRTAPNRPSGGNLARPAGCIGEPMVDTPSISQLSQVISQASLPSSSGGMSH